jgi:hypothetical protein
LPLRSARMKSVKVPPASMPRRYCCLLMIRDSRLLRGAGLD